jgi:predicted DNA-binding protein YlxM (UPF0122 family)
VNIQHLFIGTNQENTLDKVEKNRQYMILTPEDVISIFHDDRHTGEIAEAYGVTTRTILDILDGKTRHTKGLLNSEQKEARKKARRRRGEDVPISKLTEDQVLEILKDERSHRVIAEEYGVSRSNISAIKSGERWKHVHDKINGAQISSTASLADI